MLEIIYEVLSWVGIAMSVYTGYYNLRYKSLSIDEIPVKVIDSMVSKCIIVGIAYEACMAIASHLHKNGITIIIYGVCAFIWLISAKMYLKVSDYLKQTGKK